MNSLPEPAAAASPDTRVPPNSASAGSEPVTPPVPPSRVLTIEDLGSQPRSRFLPLLLFLATCFFTYAAGAYQWKATLFGMKGDDWSFQFAFDQLKRNWHDGLVYMAGVMTVLLFHEMGHFLMTVRYRVPASFPIFLPVPFMFTGTMGAVISMEGSRADRKQLFDIGLAGPLAGLVPTILLVWFGIKYAIFVAVAPGDQVFGHPMFTKLLVHWIRPDMPLGYELKMNPVYMAGWVGMFITGLNMMPVSQLDGGHTIYALFLERGHLIARTFLLSAMAFVVIGGQYTWTLMLIIVTLIGVDHPPTSNDRVPLGWARTIVGTLSLAIPIFCFTPNPLSLK